MTCPQKAGKEYILIGKIKLNYMNQNLFKAIIACGIVCFIACTTTKKAETEKWSEHGTFRNETFPRALDD